MNRTKEGHVFLLINDRLVCSCSVSDQGIGGPVPPPPQPLTETLLADSLAVLCFAEDGRLAFGL
jgi:hypothetical protein